jgi:hypothetical protein
MHACGYCTRRLSTCAAAAARSRYAASARCALPAPARYLYQCAAPPQPTLCPPPKCIFMCTHPHRAKRMRTRRPAAGIAPAPYAGSTLSRGDSRSRPCAMQTPPRPLTHAMRTPAPRTVQNERARHPAGFAPAPGAGSPMYRRNDLRGRRSRCKGLRAHPQRIPRECPAAERICPTRPLISA